MECKPLALQFNFITIVEPRILIFTTGWDIFETTIGCVANDTLPYLLTSRSALYEKWPMLWNSNFFAANNRNVSGIHGQIFFNNTLEFLFYWSVSKHSIQNYVALVLTIQENRPRLDYNTFLLMRDTSTLIEIYNSDSVYVARVNHAGNVYLRLARIQKLLHQLYILNDDHSESVFISINRHQQTILLHHSTTLHSEQLEPFRERIQSGMLIHRKFFLFTTREVWIFEKPPNLHREAPIESIPFKLYSLFAFFECNSSVAVKHSDCEIPSNMNYNCKWKNFFFFDRK